MVVFVYSADSMVECVYCHLCVWVDWVVESVQLAGPVAMIYLIAGKFGEGGNWTIITTTLILGYSYVASSSRPLPLLINCMV